MVPYVRAERARGARIVRGRVGFGCTILLVTPSIAVLDLAVTIDHAPWRLRVTLTHARSITQSIPLVHFTYLSPVTYVPVTAPVLCLVTFTRSPVVMAPL